MGGVWRQATGEESEKASWRRGAGHMSIRSRGKTQNPVAGRSGRRGGEREREHGLMGLTQVCVPRP